MAWAALVPELSRIGILTKIDTNAFERYCINLAEWRACVDFLAVHGPDLVTTNPETGEVTGVVPYPHTKRKREYEILLLKYEQEFGLTPSSRSKIHATPADDGDEIDRLNQPMRIAN